MPPNPYSPYGYPQQTYIQPQGEYDLGKMKEAEKSRKKMAKLEKERQKEQQQELDREIKAQ